MQFHSFDWLSGHGMWAIIPCPRNNNQKSSSGLFLQNEISTENLAIFRGVFIKKLFYFRLLNITNSALISKTFSLNNC